MSDSPTGNPVLDRINKMEQVILKKLSDNHEAQLLARADATQVLLTGHQTMVEGLDKLVAAVRLSIELPKVARPSPRDALEEELIVKLIELAKAGTNKLRGA